MSGYPNGIAVVEVDRHHVLATYRNVVVCVWLGDTQSSAVDAASATLAQLSNNYGRRVGIVQVIESGARSLNSDARGALASLLNRGREYIRASAVVCDGAGFRSATVRMIVSGLVQLSSPGFPHQVFADTTSAARLIALNVVDNQAQSAEFASTLISCIAEIRGGAKEALPAGGKSTSLPTIRR